MPIKVKATLNLKGIPKEIKKEFLKTRADKKEVEAAIVEEMIHGRSPVKGKQWKEYSPGYAKQKRGSKSATKPVDMVLSGDMVKSLTLTKHSDGEVSINFAGEAIKARYHDFPKANSNMPQRRLLPRAAGEEFKRSIQKVINEMLIRAATRVILAANR